MEKEIQGLKYRPEIDGLRALAIIPVVFFHASLGFPGGYVGVDVFFVISGFLVTSLILRELERGDFSMLKFWKRRVWRLMPALITVIAATLTLGCFLFLPTDLKKLGASTIAQSMLVANGYFWRDDSQNGGYFGPTAEERPLLHTWSLAVEEQFYLIIPIVLVLLWKFSSVRSRRMIVKIFALSALLSLLCAWIGMHVSPGATFYLLPGRAWELLVGCLIAAIPNSSCHRNAQVREAASWLGLGGIIVPVFVYSKETAFPGLAAIPPCAGTALIIWGNTRTGNASVPPTSLGNILSWRPFVFTGVISYSLYLWHWPIIVFGTYWLLPTERHIGINVGLVGISTLLAIGCWRWIETPLRKKGLGWHYLTAPRLMVGAALLFVIAGGSLVKSQGWPSRLPSIVIQNSAVEEDYQEYAEMEIQDIQSNRVIPLGELASKVSPTLLLWGDSHAKQAIQAMFQFCSESGIGGVAIVHSATPPVVDGTYIVSRYGLNARAPDFASAVIKYVKHHGISSTILAARWSAYQELDERKLEVDLLKTIRLLLGAGSQVWVLMDVPDLDGPAPRLLARESLFGYSDQSWLRKIEEHHSNNSSLYRMATIQTGARFLDPAVGMYDHRINRYIADKDGVSLYHDDDHLSIRGSKLILLPLFREFIPIHSHKIVGG